MMSKTQLKDLNENKQDIVSYEEELKDENLAATCVDLSLPEKIRMSALEAYYDHNGSQETVEIINKLTGMYQFSQISILKKYLYNICINSTINSFLKTIAIKSLCYNAKDDCGYKAIDLLYPKMGTDVPSPCKVEIVLLLMKNKKYKNKAKEYFGNFVCDDSIDCSYRYKTILSLEHIDLKNKNYFLFEACWTFFQYVKNPTLYRILACQYLLQKYNKKLTDFQFKLVEDTLLSFATDNELDYNLRADSADVLLQLGSDANKMIAKDVILFLGREGHLVQTLYDDAQNVHIEEIDKSVMEIIEFLATFPTYTIKSIEDLQEEKESGKVVKGSDIIFSHVRQGILKLLETEKIEKKIDPNEKYEREETIKVSLERINIDRALYSEYNCTLSFILVKLWSYMIEHESKEEMMKRLLDELEEMAGTCSSGFVSRLVNSITGFGDFSLRISWRDQIIANLGGRLNARARQIDDIEHQEEVLCEMRLKTNDYEARKNFLRFFRKNLLSIRDEMYSEFCKYIDDATFDLSFRAAIATYETGSYV